MDANSLRKIIASLIASFEGNAFQAFSDRLNSVLYPDDYQRVRPGGPHGDTKNDGYCPKKRVFIAAHATRGEPASKTMAKIKGDLEGCIEHHRDLRIWRYLTNDVLTGQVDAFVDNELRPTYPGLTIEVWDHERLADEISELDVPQIEKILDVIIGSEDVFQAPGTSDEPFCLILDPAYPKEVILRELSSGLDIWNVVSEVAQYQFGQPSNCTEVELDELAGIFDQIKDGGEISGDLFSMVHQRDVQRGLGELLQQAREAGFELFGCRRMMLLKGGASSAPTPWARAIINALRLSEVEELKRKASEGP